jgi:hypothetical protein
VHISRQLKFKAAKTARTTDPCASRFSEVGDTLIEVLLAVVVLGLASVALLIAFGTSISASADHRNLATFNTILASASQEAISLIQQDPALFTCPASSYPSAYPTLSVPAPYTSTYAVQYSSTSPVQWWNASTGQFSTTCVANAPMLVTISATEDSNGETIPNSFVVDYPLSPSDTFSSGPASQLKWLFSPSTGDPAGTAFAPQQPVVEVVDANGNPVINDDSPVTLTITSGTGGFGAILSSCAGNEVNGVVTFSGCTINMSSATPYTLTASDGTLPQVASQPFLVSAAAYQLVFTQQPVGGLSGAALTTQPQLKMESSTGVIDLLFTGPSAVVTLTSSAGNLAGCTNLTATLGVVNVANCTFAGGYFYNSVSNTYNATPYTMTATATGYIPVISSSFKVTGAGAVAGLYFSSQPTGVASTTDTTDFTGQPVVTVTDSFGNVVTTAANSVTLSISGGQTLTCSDSGTNGDTTNASGGAATFSGCNGSAYGNGLTLTAKSGTFTATSTPFNITGIASQLVFSAQPAAGVSGDEFTTQPTITVEDSSNDVVTSWATTITLTSSAGGTLSFCTNLTPVLGVAAVQNCTFGGTVGSPYTVTATSGSLSGTSNTFSPTSAGVPAKLIFTTSPTAGPAGSLFTVQPVIKVEDSSGNIVTSNATITLTNSGGVLSSCTGLTAVAGVASVSNCLFGGLVGTNYTLSASSGTLTGSISSTFTPSAPGTPVTLVYTTPPPSLVVDGTTFPVVVNELDVFGNLETIDSTSPVTLSANNGGGGFTCSTDPTVFTGGIATYAGCEYTSGSLAPFTLSASSGSLTPATAPMTVYGVPTRLVYATPPPTSIGAGVNFPIVVNEEDVYGNIETLDSTTTLALAANNGGGGFACSTMPAHVTNGVATYSGCSFTLPNAYTITGTSAGLTSATANITVNPGTPTKLVYATAPPSSTTAGTTFSVVVEEEDQFSNIETLDSTTTLALAANNGGGGFTCSTMPAQVTNGIATFSGCSYTTASATPFTLTASSTGLTSTTANTTVSPAVKQKLVYTTAPPSSVVAGVTFSVVVNEEDQFNNIETGDSTTTLTLTAGGGFTCLTTPGQVTNGVATFSNCSFTTASATPYTITAASSGITSATANTTVTPATATKLVYATAPPSTVTAGATFSVIVNEEDQFNNIETGDSTTTLSLAANFGGGGFACLTTPTKVTNGVATFSNCSYTTSTSGTPYTLTASATGKTPATATTAVNAAAKTKLVYVTPPPSSVAAGTTFSVIVNEEDQFNNIETGDSTTTLTLTAGGGFACITPPAHVTAGVATFSNCSFMTASASPYTVTAASAGITSVLATTTVTPGTPTSIVLTGCSSSIASNATCVATATLEDTFGNVETTNNSGVTFNKTAGTGSVNGLASVTNFTNGVANVTLTGNVVGSVTIDATGSSLTSGPVTFSVTPGTASKLIFTTQPGNGVSGSPLTTQPVVTVEDSNGNTVTGSTATVTLTKTGGTGAGTLSGCTLNAVAGVATFTTCTINVTTDGTFVFTAASAGLTSATSGTFTADGVATKVVFTTQPSNGSSGTALATQPVVTVEDALGHTVVGSTVAVTLTSNNGTGTGTLAGCTTAVNAVAGIATFANCSITVATDGTFSLNAASGALTAALSSTFVETGAATQVVFTTQPVNGTSGTALATQPVATIEDAAGTTVTTDTANVTLSLVGGTGTGTLAGCTGAVAAVNGVATFSSCAVNVTGDGTFNLDAGSAGLTTGVSNTFTVTGAANHLVFTTQPGNGTNGNALATQPVVTVEDAAGNAVVTSSASVGLTRNQVGSARGTLTGCTSNVTAINGVATFSGCALTVTTDGAFTLTAAATGLTSATSNNFTDTGVATQLVFTLLPSNGISGVALTTQPVVTVEDAAGSTVVTSSASITLTRNQVGGTGTLSGCTTAVNAINGVATFSGCTITLGTDGTFTLSAASAGLTTGVTSNFTVTGVATKVVFTTQPGNGISGSILTTQPVANIEDAAGNTVASSSAAITLSLVGGTGTGTLSGCTSTTINGVAMFSGCIVAVTTDGTFTLSAASTGLTSNPSSAFTATGVATRIIFSTQPVGAAHNSPMATQPVVTEQDAAGNTVAGDSTTHVTLSKASGKGNLSCTTNPVTLVNGVATFAGCTFSAASTPTDTLLATDGAFTATSFTFVMS